MINLLSPHDKRELRAARRNVVLTRYNVVIGFTLIIISCIYGGGFFLTTQQKSSAEQQLSQDNARTVTYATVKNEMEQFTKNLSTAKAILANDISYSSLIIDIAKTLPSGTVLTSLSLTPDSFGKQVTLSASAASYSRALALKEALENSDLFSNVAIASVGETAAEGSSNKAYPISVSLNTTLISEAALKAKRTQLETTP